MVLNFGFVFVILFASVLNGAGDTTTPMLIAMVQSVFSLFFEWLLIFGHLNFPRLGIEGVAIGQASGQAICIGISLAVLLRGSSRVHVRLRHLVPGRASTAAHRRALLGTGRCRWSGSLAVNAYFLILAGRLWFQGPGGLLDRGAHLDDRTDGRLPSCRGLRHAGRPEPRRGEHPARLAFAVDRSRRARHAADRNRHRTRGVPRPDPCAPSRKIPR